MGNWKKELGRDTRWHVGHQGYLNLNQNANFTKLDRIQTLAPEAGQIWRKNWAAGFGVKNNFCY
jgi:hypothetical protein